MKIESIEALPVRLPRDLEGARRTAGSPTLLEAATSDYRWSAVFPALYSIHFETALIKVATNEGLTGWGEAQAPLAPEVACTIIERLLKPALLGAEFDGTVAGIRELWRRMYSTMRVRGQTGGFMLDAISGVDLALWDLAGKAQGLPAAKLIRRDARGKVPAYLSGVPGATLAERVAAARARWAGGFRAFKLFHDSTADELFATLDALRESLGQETRLAVDALWRLTPETAPGFCAELDRRNVWFLEAPLPPEDAPAHGALAATIHTPLALGESYRTSFELAPFFRARALGFAQPDLGRTGITEGLHIAALAAEHGVPVVPHVSIALGPQVAAAIHFAASIEDCPFLEFNPGVLEVANRYLEQPLQVESAHYQAPQGPGLGVEICEAALRADCLR